jgi:hypothetical protein
MATVYIAPTAQGLGDGTSAANAYGYSSLDTAEADAGNGGTILFTDGTYTFSGNQTWDTGGFADMTYKSLNQNGAYLLGSTITRSLFIGSTTTSTAKLEGFKSGNVHYDAEHSTTLTLNFITHADTFEDGPGNYGFLGSTNNSQSHVCTNSSFVIKYDATGKFGVYWGANSTIDRCSFFLYCTNTNASGITSTGFSSSLTNCIIASNNSSAISSSVINTANCTNCCIYDLHSGDTSGGTDNIFVDPQFVDAPNGDLRLRPSSPCINAGTAS